MLVSAVGDLHRSRGNHAEARDRLREALRIHEAWNDAQGIYEDSRSLGHALRKLEAYEESEASHRRAMRVAERLGRISWRVESMIGVGDALFGRGARDEARSMWIEARDAAFRAGAHDLVDEIQRRLGRRR